MAWIEVHQSLPSHRKTRRLARELKLNGKDFAKAVGHLVMLWLWAVDNAPNGDLSGIDAYDIADAAQWAGDPDKFLTALKTAGFVDEDGYIHDWDMYIGKLIERREANAKRNREARARKKAAGTNKKNGASRDGGMGQSGISHDAYECIASVSRDTSRYTENASRDVATVPNPTVPNQTIPYLSLSNSPSVVENEGERVTERENAVLGISEKPTLEMVRAYAAEMGYEVDAEQFVQLNEQRGWKDSWGREIRDWKMWLDGYVRSGVGRAAKGSGAVGGKTPTFLNYPQRTYEEGELDYILNADLARYMEEGKNEQ